MKIAIAGYGVEGQENYRYWSQFPGAELTIVDERNLSPEELPAGADTLLGEGAFSTLNGFDLVIRTAGLAPRKISTDGRVWSATNEFFAKCPATIIGVTGSKGKGTTASLIVSILEKAGKTVWFVGNIGKPALEVLAEVKPDDIVVYELSSFQLWDIQRSPHTAVVLYIEQEHLDVHDSMEDYVAAKRRITEYQKGDDLLIYNHQNQYAQSIANHSHAHKIGYPSRWNAHIEDDHFYYDEHKICSTHALRIRGEHNLENALAAIDAVWQYTQEPAVIEAGLADFKGLPHRLSFVTTVGGVEYYDDSIATTPSAAVAAMKSFEQPKVIILGGSSKGSDFGALVEEIIHQKAFAVLIGDEATNLASSLDGRDYHDYVIANDQTMPAIVAEARRHAEPGSVVLLSPAAASFGLFKNYADRGDQFIAAVRALS